MKMRHLGAVLAIAGLAMTQQTAAAWAWGAIAVSNKQASRFGYSYDYPTERQAINRAVSECGRGCRAVVTFRRGCGAYAYGGTGADSDYGIGRGGSRAAAENDALEDCELATWDECHIKVWACNGY